MIFDKTVWCIYNIVAFSNPSFLQCEALVFAPAMEANSSICTIMSFYVCAFVSKPFRVLMTKHLRLGSLGNWWLRFLTATKLERQKRAIRAGPMRLLRRIRLLFTVTSSHTLDNSLWSEFLYSISQRLKNRHCWDHNLTDAQRN